MDKFILIIIITCLIIWLAVRWKSKKGQKLDRQLHDFFKQANWPQGWELFNFINSLPEEDRKNKVRTYKAVRNRFNLTAKTTEINVEKMYKLLEQFRREQKK